MMDIPEAISNLKLCRAFKGHNPDMMDCALPIADKEFFVEDSREVGCTIYTCKKIDDKSCKVSNSTDEAVILLPIDGKFIINHKGGIADSALFNTKDFHFVEFKSNAEGNTDNAVKGTYSKAMDQLNETLNIFESKINAADIDFRKKVNVTCHIIVSETFPRNSAAEQTNAIAFAKRTKGIPLECDNDIEFL